MSSWTEADLRRLERALAKGALTVQYEDRRVTYRSLDEMIRLRDLISRDVQGATSSPRRRYARHDKGL